VSCESNKRKHEEHVIKQVCGKTSISSWHQTKSQLRNMKNITSSTSRCVYVSTQLCTCMWMDTNQEWRFYCRCM